MPYRAPHSHVWFRSPSPIYSPPTPPAEEVPATAPEPAPGRSALLQAIDDAAAITYDVSPYKPATPSTSAKRSCSKSLASQQTPLSSQQGISSFLVATESKHKRKATKLTPNAPHAPQKKQATEKIVFDRIPSAKANDTSLPIVAGLKKQQDLEDKRQSTSRAFGKANKPIAAKPSKVVRQVREVKPVLKSTPREMDNDWLVANLDILLPPLSRDELDELEDDEDIQDVGSSAPFVDSSSPRQPSPRSAATFGIAEGEERSEGQSANLFYSPPSSPTSSFRPFAAGDETFEANEHEALDEYDQYMSERNPGVEGSHSDVFMLSLHSQAPHAQSITQPISSSSSSTAYVSSSADPYNHPDFSHSSESDWSTLPAKRSTGGVPLQSKIALSKKFTLPSRVFGQAPKVSIPHAACRAVEPIPLKKGVKLFKPDARKVDQSKPLYTVHTQIGMRFGPLIDEEERVDLAEAAPQSSPRKIKEPVVTPRPARLKKYAFDTSTTQLTDWSEFSSLSVASQSTTVPTEVEDDTNVNFLKLAPYFDAVDYDNPLSPPSSLPSSPTFPFSLSACLSGYPALRMALEHAPAPVRDLSELSEAHHLRLEALILDHCRWQ